MKQTGYFKNEVRKRRPYIKDAWLERALAETEYTEVQPNGRIRHWIYVEELGKYFRVVTEADDETVITAFPDRSFKPEDH